jgi:ribose 5-phosphate isomerase B
MEPFTLITETDAIRLEPGSTVLLAPGGRVTPLAADTLRDRGITVVVAGEAVLGDASRFVPVADIRTVAIGSDHTGLDLKTYLAARLRATGRKVLDVGTHTRDAVDYPDIAREVVTPVVGREADAGIVIDGAGLGSTMAANKVPGIRAAMCTTPTLARYARQHNGANVLALGATLVTADEAGAICDVFVETPMTEPRYIRRLAKLAALEVPAGRR